MPTYTVILEDGEDGWICASIAEVPGAISQGRTIAEAMSNVGDALQLVLDWRSDAAGKH